MSFAVTPSTSSGGSSTKAGSHPAATSQDDCAIERAPLLEGETEELDEVALCYRVENGVMQSLGRGNLRVTKVPASAATGGQERSRVIFVIKLETREKVMLNGAPFQGMVPRRDSKTGKGGKVKETVSVQLAVAQGEQTEIKPFVFKVKDAGAAERAVKALQGASARC